MADYTRFITPIRVGRLKEDSNIEVTKGADEQSKPTVALKGDTDVFYGEFDYDNDNDFFVTGTGYSPKLVEYLYNMYALLCFRSTYYDEEEFYAVGDEFYRQYYSLDDVSIYYQHVGAISMLNDIHDNANLQALFDSTKETYDKVVELYNEHKQGDPEIEQ